MKTSTYNAWWRDMGAISRGMMFIEGGIATPATLDRTERVMRTATASEASPPREARPPKRAEKSFSLYEDLLFLGGRPMTAGHNEDIDESFVQTRDAGSQPGSHRFDGHRRKRITQARSCASC